MASKATYKCDNCKSDFEARTADRKRGWARFCSKSCKAKKQEKRTGQYSAYLHKLNSSNRFTKEDIFDSVHPFSCEGLGQWCD